MRRGGGGRVGVVVALEGRDGRWVGRDGGRLGIEG